MSDSFLYYKSIKDTPVCGNLDFICLKLKYEVLKLGVWMSDPYLYHNSINTGSVWAVCVVYILRRVNASEAFFNCIGHSYGRIAKTWLMLCQFVYAAVMQFGGFTLR